MTIRHLNIFVTVYRTESITRAAEILYMTQPAVTRSIKELENYYGIVLFERINQRISVTEAGKQFYDYAIHIVDSFHQMEQSMKNWDELGILRIGASVTLGSILLPSLTKEFKLRHPRIQLRLTVTTGTKLQKLLENNEIDLALIENTIFNDRLITEEFSQDRLVLLLPPDSPLMNQEKIYLEELQKYPLLLREGESVNRILIDHVFESRGLSITPFMESISVHAIIQAIHEGIGISLLPENLVAHSIQSGFIAARTLVDENFIRKNYIVYHKNKLLTPALQNFIDLCKTNHGDRLCGS